MPYNVFPAQGDIVTQCDAVERGYLPKNEYHVSFNVYSNYILVAKVQEAQLTGEQTIYPTLLPLDIRPSPQDSMGGTFTLVFGDGPVKEIKWYNLIYHVLRGLSQKKLRVPTQSTRQVASFLESWRQMKQRLVENKEHLGGYRIETLVAARTVDGAVDLYMENEVFR